MEMEATDRGPEKTWPSLGLQKALVLVNARLPARNN